MSQTTNDQTFTIVRELAAPLAQVWTAYTQPEELARWWGPAGFKMDVCNIDLREGGMFHYGMTAPNGGGQMWGRWIFRDVRPAERLVFEQSFSDAAGGVTRHPFAKDWPLQTLCTLSFAEKDGKTVVTIEGRPLDATPDEVAAYFGAVEGMKKGFAGTFAQLDAHLARPRTAAEDRLLTHSRLFDAPRALVYAAFTDPKQVTQWWGPNGFRTTITDMNVAPGGSWNFVMHGPDGKDWPNQILFIDVAPDERLAYAHGSGKSGDRHFHACTTFVEEGGRTRVTMRLILDSADEREQAATYALEGGRQTLARLAGHLQKRA